MQLVEQTHLSSPPFFVCFRVAQSLVFCVVVVLFLFGPCNVCPLINDF